MRTRTYFLSCTVATYFIVLVARCYLWLQTYSIFTKAEGRYDGEEGSTRKPNFLFLGKRGSDHFAVESKQANRKFKEIRLHGCIVKSDMRFRDRAFLLFSAIKE